MSEESKKYRAEMKEKARRLGGSGDPHQKVDASSWTEAEAMNPEAPTGPRPVSKRRNYKRGGHVEGHEAIRHAGRRPRKDGGKALVRDLENADVKEANEDREGIKHEGGMKRGGRAAKAGGGGLGVMGPMVGLIPQLIASGMGGDNDKPAPYSPGTPGKKAGGRAKRDVGGTALASLLPGGLQQGNIPTSRFNFQNGPSQMSRAAGLKKGGEARKHRAEGGEAAHKNPFGPMATGPQSEWSAKDHQNAANYYYHEKMGATEDAMGPNYKPYETGMRQAYEHHTRQAKAARAAGRATGGGATYKEQFSHQDGGRDPRAHGGKLDAAERRDLPKKDFGEPGSRKYPMPDKSHAANAKARASEMEHKGRLSKGEEEKIDAKADRVLGRKEGGRANGKGKMSVNIVIAPGHAAPPAAAGPPPGAPMIPPPRPPVPMPPPGMPPGGLPPGMGAGPPPMMPPPGAIPGRKRGGRLDTQGGGGGGLGRLEKIEDYGDRAREGEAHR